MSRRDCLQLLSGASMAGRASKLIDNAPDAAIQQKLLVDNPARLFKFT
ncbi:hypothetical protein [Bradyrhizobium sp. UFLA05-112]